MTFLGQVLARCLTHSSRPLTLFAQSRSAREAEHSIVASPHCGPRCQSMPCHLPVPGLMVGSVGMVTGEVTCVSVNSPLSICVHLCVLF